MVSQFPIHILGQTEAKARHWSPHISAPPNKLGGDPHKQEAYLLQSVMAGTPASTFTLMQHMEKPNAPRVTRE